MQAIALVGAPTVVSFYLLGMIPWLPPPMQTEVLALLKANAQAVQAHVAMTEELRNAAVWTCRGQWKNEPLVQERCGKSDR